MVAWSCAVTWLYGGAGGGLVAAVLVGAADVVERGALTQTTANGIVLLLLGGGVVGYVVQLARRAEHALADAVQREAAASERERLSRSVHDGVLQALALAAGGRPTRSSPAEPLRLVVADDHPIWRDAVERDLAAAGLVIVGVAVDGDKAVRVCTATVPDVLVCDLQMPGRSGV